MDSHLRSRLALHGAAICLLVGWAAVPVQAQDVFSDTQRSPTTSAMNDAFVEYEYEPQQWLRIPSGVSRLLRTRVPVHRISVINPEIVEVLQHSPTEFEIVAGQGGITTIVFWFGDPNGPPQMHGYRVIVGGLPLALYEQQGVEDYIQAARKYNALVRREAAIEKELQRRRSTRDRYYRRFNQAR